MRTGPRCGSIARWKYGETFAEKGDRVLSANVIAGAVSVNSVQVAPAVLAKSVTAVAIAKGATLSGTTLTLINGALKLMAWTKAKTAIAAGIGVLLAAGTATFTVREIGARHHEAWQEQYDLLATGKQGARRRSEDTAISQKVGGAACCWKHDGKILKVWEKISADVMLAAYGWKFNDGQLIFSVPVPEGQYDFISNLAQGQN